MRILVTGGAGYIGSTLVHQLLKDGHDVRVLDLLLGSGQSLLWASRSPRFEMVVGDIRNRHTVAQALAGCDAVVHLAAVVGTPACDRSPDEAIATNIGGTETLLACRSRGQRFIFASTGSVYGVVSSGHCDEESVPDPATLYGRTKVDAEQMVLEAGDSVILRLATVFGVGRASRWDLLVNSLTLQAVTAGAITLYQPNARRSFIHVRDVGRALRLPIHESADMKDGVYNVGDDALNVTKADVGRAVCGETGASLALDATGEDPDKRDYIMSFSRIGALGFAARCSLPDGIKELARAAKLVKQPSSPTDR